MLYRHAGRPVSLFMMPRTTRPETKVAIAGRVASIWSHGDTTYVLLGDESERDLQAITYQSAEADGAVALKAAVDWFDGVELEPVRYLPKHVITQADVDKYMPAQW